MSVTRTKAIFPLRLYSALCVIAFLTWLAWYVWRPQVRVTRPTLDVRSEAIIASTLLTNRSSNPCLVTIRFDLGYQVMGTDYAASKFQLIASRDVPTEIAARSRQTVTCEFSPPQKPLPFLADAQIVSLR